MCFAGAATVAVSTPDSPMAKISQCVHIGCGRPQGEGTSSMKSISYAERSYFGTIGMARKGWISKLIY